MNSSDLTPEDKADALLIDGRPDWEAITFEVHCSRCGYNLRTLTNPRCPECGFEFEWKLVIEAFFRKNFALFEHNWRKQPIRSLLRALFGPIFLPSRFWKRVSLHDQINGGPLAFLILMTLVWFGLGFVASALLLGLLVSGAFYFDYLPRTAGYYGQSSPSFSEMMVAIEMDLWIAVELPLTSPMFFVALPLAVILVTLGLMCSLHETIARFRLRRGHMMRVVAYAAGPAAVLTGTLVNVFSTATLIGYMIGFRTSDWDPVIQFSVSVLLLGFPLAVQLRSGMQYYLAIPHAKLAAALITIAAILAGIIIGMLMSGVLV